MGKKENRPDACTASGTASIICDYDSTFVSAGQDMTENEHANQFSEMTFKIAESSIKHSSMI